MSFDKLADLLPIAAQISVEANVFECMTHLIDFGLIGQLVTILCGEKSIEDDALKTLSAFRRGASEIAMPYFRAVKVCGAEDVCGVLYAYRPKDLTALFLLIQRKQQDDFSRLYIADMLRLLVLSKSNGKAEIPTLHDCLTRKTPTVEESGQEILNRIVSAALGGKREE